MSKNRKDFFRSIDIENQEIKCILLQMGVGILIGIALVGFLGFAEYVCETLQRL